MELNFPEYSGYFSFSPRESTVSYKNASLFPLYKDFDKPKSSAPTISMGYDPPIAYATVLISAIKLLIVIVHFLPMKSENIPVGISKKAEERVTIANTLIPSAKDPEI